MWILCALIGLFQLVTLLMLSGILFSIAAVSRLMEITVILIYPTAVFLLRQSANLIILLTILATKMTSSAFRNLYALVKCNQEEAIPRRELAAQLQHDTPFVPYERNTSEEISGNASSSKDQSLTEPVADEKMVRTSQDQSQDNNPTKEPVVRILLDGK